MTSASDRPSTEAPAEADRPRRALPADGHDPRVRHRRAAPGPDGPDQGHRPLGRRARRPWPSATCAALRPTDSITSTHRGHGHAIAKGVDVERDDGRAVRPRDRDLRRQGRLDAHRRLLGRDARRERHRRRRVRDRDRRGARPCGCRGSDGVVVCFFGDSAINQGAFLENANYAALHALPVDLPVREQRVRDVDAARRARPRSDDLADRAAGVRLPGRRPWTAWTCSPSATAVAAAVARARAGDGPDADRRRLLPLRGPPRRRHRRTTATPDEAAPWRERDPIAAFRRRLAGAGAS